MTILNHVLASQHILLPEFVMKISVFIKKSEFLVW
jgi:hypothetical protein